MRVVALDTGRVQIHRRQVQPAAAGRLLATLLDRQWTPWLPVWSFAIEHPAGVVVVDAGQDPGFTLPGWDLYGRRAVRFDVSESDRVEARLREAGLDPGAVTHHVFTHTHIDHVGAGPVAGVRPTLSAAEWKAASRPGARVTGFIAHDISDPITVQFDGPAVGAIPGSHDLLGDGTIRLLPTPGHTVGHLSVLVDDGDGPRILIAGDVVYNEAQLVAGGIDGVAQSARRARTSVRNVQIICRQRPTVVLPTHDPGAADRLARLAPTQVA